MQLMLFLILCPLIVAALLFCIRNNSARNVIAIGGAIVIAVATVIMVFTNMSSGYVSFECESQVVDMIGTIVGVLIAACILYFAIKFKNILAIALALVQVVLSLIFDVVVAPQCSVEIGLYFDQLTLLMTFIIGVVGSGICVYAIGYMQDFQAHEPEGAKDRRPFFFAIMFLFLCAMFIIVFSNNMVWLFTGWEVSTVCSFLLIGYTRTEEAMKSAFRQINMNLAGGIAFILALYSCVYQAGTLDFAEFISLGSTLPQVTIFAVCALSFAGMTKAAQMPFHTWLLGAMVAPTPTSALLHSSTMVKAGVFMLVKLAPCLAVCAIPSYMVMIVGGFTFLACSCLAISQSNAKRVLAYSTIANLGLITACAGVGTPEAVWAAMFLILFHAIAKSLLFLCVGTAEHHIGSRNIEDMDLLFERMPRLARYMLLGIMCMFIAPFGMLIAKWATLESFAAQGDVILILMLAFGSAATFMFWAKWFGKLTGIAATPENVEKTVHGTEWAATTLMVVLICACCILLPVISMWVVEPYLFVTYFATVDALGSGNLWISAILSLIVILVLFVGLGRSSKQRKVNVYMAGISVDNEQREFRNSLTGTSQATARNWYLEGIFGEDRLTVPSQVFTGVFTGILLVASLFFSLL